MPQIVFSEEEKAAIEAVVAEFDPEYHELTQGLRAILSEDDWQFIVGSMRKTLRRDVEARLAQPIIEKAKDYYESHADPDGQDRFYHLGVAAEQAHPLEGEDHPTWGRSPVWAASSQLTDAAEQAVVERLQAA